MIGDKEGSVVGVVNVGDLVGSLVVGTSDGGKLNVGVVAAQVSQSKMAWAKTPSSKGAHERGESYVEIAVSVSHVCSSKVCTSTRLKPPFRKQK